MFALKCFRFGGLIALMCTLAGAGPPGSGSAQIQFVPLDADSGFVHVSPYGTTFPFTPDQHPFIPPAVMTTMQRNMGNGVAIGDYDGDGDEDVYLLGQLGFANALFRNDSTPGSLHFADQSLSSGLGLDGLSRVAHFSDLDNDGWQDLILLNDSKSEATYPTSRILRNVGGVFDDVTEGSGFDPVGYLKGGMCLGDYDEDGLLDIYTTVWLMHGLGGPASFEGHNRLYRNLGGFHFEDVTTNAGLPVLGRDSFSCAFADFDNDGDSDLYVAIDNSSDAYFRNEAGVFYDDTVAVGATHIGNDMGIAVGDMDCDGDLDIYSTNITDSPGGFGTGRFNTMLINQVAESGTFAFIDEAQQRGVEDTAWGWGTEFLDVDNDGDLDLYAVNGFDEWVRDVMGPSYPLLATPAVLFVQDAVGDLSPALGTGLEITNDARAAVAHDFDHDGLVASIDQPAYLLENRTIGAGHWLVVDAVGGGSVNADAVGSRVIVTDGGRTQMCEIIAGGSYLSGRPHEAHFGLGASDSADEVRVQWPDGSELILQDVVADRRLRIHKTPGDANLDGRIDLADFAILQRCAGGTSEPFTRCSAFDFDLDQDLDADDWTAFLNQF